MPAGRPVRGTSRKTCPIGSSNSSAPFGSPPGCGGDSTSGPSINKGSPLSSLRPGGGLCNSEIRLISGWDRSVFFCTVFMRVFCTDLFRPLTEDAPISFGRGPRRCEDFFVFHRELELQSLALVRGVGRPPCTDPLTAAIVLFSTTLPGRPRGFVIDQLVSFDHVQSLSERCAVLVDEVVKKHAEMSLAHGIPVPGWCHPRLYLGFAPVRPWGARMSGIRSCRDSGHIAPQHDRNLTCWGTRCTLLRAGAVL